MAEKPQSQSDDPARAQKPVVTPMFVEPTAVPAKPAKSPAKPPARTPAKPETKPKAASKGAAPADGADGAASEALASEVLASVEGASRADDEAPAKPASPGAKAPESAADVPVRVLVAEDEALIRLDLAEMLTEAGYEVVGQASDGQQAVELAEELRPDMVIMDVKMPRLDGISAAERIGDAGIAPVVMLTAFSDRQLVDRARDAGVMAYVVKPFTINDLMPALSIARSRWGERQALEAEVADLQERFETRKKLDRAKGLLQTQLGLDEAAAFRWIQKAAMDRRMSMREVAEAVISGVTDKSKR